MEKTIFATFFDSLRSNKATQTLSLQEFLQFLGAETAHVAIANKDDAPVFATCTYGPEDSRKRENIISVHGIVLDIDQPMTRNEATGLTEKLELFGIAFWVYSTFSSEPDTYKLRMVVPLATSVSPEKYESERFAARWAEKLGIEIDSACERSSQVYFLPTCPPGTEGFHFCIGKQGRLLDESELPRLKNSRVKKPDSKVDSAREDAQIIADEITQHISGGVEPIFCGDAFWIYIDGVRVRVSVKSIESYAYNDIFGRNIKLSDIRAAIGVLKVAGYTETMPQPSNVELVNFAGTTVNLRTGQVVENTPEHLLSIMIQHAFDPNAECPLFNAFLGQILENDPDAEAKKAYLQQWMGYLLMPTAKFQQMLWLAGPGANGKSILTALMSRMLGLENTSAVPLSTFGTRFATSDLFGKLANITDEAGADYYLNDNTIKEIVGGSRVRAEYKGKDAFNFETFARLVVSTNHLPRTKDTSHGYFRRIVILELNRIFSKAEQDPDLLEKLLAEMPGIVRFAIEGAGKLLRDGKFAELPSSVEAVERYMADANPVRQFFAEALIPDAIDPTTHKQFKILKIEMYAIFREYCLQRGNIAPAANVFGKRLKELGLNDAKSCGKTYWLCGLTDPSDWLRSTDDVEAILARHTCSIAGGNVVPLKPARRVEPIETLFAEG